MKQLISLLDRSLYWLLALLMTLMVLDVTWQVLTRFVMSQPSSFTEELAGFLLIWIGILGSAYAFRFNAHLGLDLITAKLTGASALNVRRIGLLVSFAFAAGVMVLGGGYLVQMTFELNQVSAALGIRMGYVYLAVPFSGLLICIYALAFLFNGLDADQSYSQ